MPGPPPKPTALKLLAGNPGHRELPSNEPQPVQELFPEPPDWLDEEAARCWNLLVPDLVPLGLCTRIDKIALGRYCTYFAQWLRIKIQLESNPSFTMPVYGHMKRVNPATGCFEFEPATHEVLKDRFVKKLTTVPQFNQMLKLDQAMRRLESEFGFTPAARTRISVEMKNQQNGTPAASQPGKRLGYRDRRK